MELGLQPVLNIVLIFDDGLKVREGGFVHAIWMSLSIFIIITEVWILFLVFALLPQTRNASFIAVISTSSPTPTVPI